MKHSTLHNQQIVIIGGTSGLGLATAQQAIEQGAKVIIGGSSREQLATALAELGPNASGHQLDILDVDSVNHFFNQLDSLDHLVITAAVMRPGSFLTAAIEDLKINMDSPSGEVFMRSAPQHPNCPNAAPSCSRPGW
ncbi:SDR family NAD(P)-dependent oxidoreductase [Aeromonas sp. 97A]|uniref:SDR family NAD(P)-dependent oxidoreductase n=1 Tax=Aeromonas sp. 97A TaxID=3452731 RepID=UPI003F7A6473